jgi:outer membrane protein assembly factor BamB
MPGGLLTLSADGATKGTGIVWATVPLKGLTDGQDNNGDANKRVVEGILYAYDATDFQARPNWTLKLLWDSKRIPGNTFRMSKFCPPVVANGKVYVTTYDGRVDVYGI